jgi:hypothetical protein
MGLIETLVGHVSVKSVLVLVPGLLFAYIAVALVVRPAWEEMKLARMPGARAPKVKTYWPFGKSAMLVVVPSLSKTGLADTTQVLTLST